MADCESCKNYGYVAECVPCDNGSNFERIVQTNADRIRAMSDEELAEFLYGLGHYWDDGQCILRINDNHLNDYKDDILDWLQSEAETKGE